MTKGSRSAPVGVVGLGAMGMGTALALRDSGLDVVGFDVSSAACRNFVSAGGRVAENPATVAQECGVVLIMVVNSEQVEGVLFGAGGMVETMHKGGLVIQSATVAPSYARDLGERLTAVALGLLDAPVSGGAAKAREGCLSVMASGSEAHFKQASVVLDSMAEKVYHLGDAPGSGSSVKLVNQHLAGVHIAAAAEAMALGIRMGLDPETLYEVIRNSAGNSWMFENRVPHILAGDYAPFSAVDIFVKDLGIVNSTGRELTLPLPVASTALQQFIAASAAGHGSEDDSAVIKVYEHLSDLKLPSGKRD